MQLDLRCLIWSSLTGNPSSLTWHEERFQERCTDCQEVAGWMLSSSNLGLVTTFWHMLHQCALYYYSLTDIRATLNFEPGFVKKAAEEQVIVFCLPPHTTHLTQPLDKGCFGPPKIYWREECQDYIASNPGKVVTRFHFSQLFSWACYRGMTMHNIITGFRITGVFPFNRHALRPSDKDLQPKSLSQQTGLKYIPLFSPAPAKHRSQAATPSFSEAERAKFQQRFEEGYDLDIDPKYDLWKRMYHPDNCPTPSPLAAHSSLSHQLSLSPPPPSPSPFQLNVSSSEVLSSDSDQSPENKVSLLPRPTTIFKVLPHHIPHLKPPTFIPKSRARVLTSSENRSILEQKVREKEKEELKENEIEVKRKEKDELKAKQRREREAKQKKS